MKVLIVEDEQLAAERLSLLIKNYDSDISLLDPIDSVEETVRFLKEETEVDLLFLDIQLADGKSFEIFNKINCDKPVIFTTAYDQYSLNAFKVNSIDYLLKPVKAEELKAAIDKFKKVRASNSFIPLTKKIIQELFQASQNQYKKRFLVKQGSRFLFKAVDDIAYFFAEAKMAYLVSKENNKQFIIDHTLEELEESFLDPAQFFRISRKHIVNIDAINEVRLFENTRLEVKLLVPCDQALIVSRERVSEFKQWLDR